MKTFPDGYETTAMDALVEYLARRVLAIREVVSQPGDVWVAPHKLSPAVAQTPDRDNYMARFIRGPVEIDDAFWEDGLRVGGRIYLKVRGREVVMVCRYSGSLRYGGLSEEFQYDSSQRLWLPLKHGEGVTTVLGDEIAICVNADRLSKLHLLEIHVRDMVDIRDEKPGEPSLSLLQFGFWVELPRVA